MADITLAASTRNSLLSVKDTMGKMATTQRRLESGKAVDSAIDDAVKYFKAKGLTDRAQDFTELKSNIDQNISMVKTAVVGLGAVNSIYKQMKGLLQKVKVSSPQEVANISVQWRELLKQADNVGLDATYNGKGLIQPDPQPYPANFDMSSYWDPNKDAGYPRTPIQTASDGSGISVPTIALPRSDVNVTPGATETVTNWIPDPDPTHPPVYVPGWYTWDPSDTQHILTAHYHDGYWMAPVIPQQQTITSPDTGTFVDVASLLDNPVRTQKAEQWCDKAISYINAAQAEFGGAIKTMQDRVNFVGDYTNTLQEGSGKLVLADLNEEGANLVACQTRQQIGIQSVAISGQQQQSILSLLR